MKFGLCGNPVVHSLSPKLFRTAYPDSNHTYELIQTSDPHEAIRLFKEGGFAGINVTAPLKTSILPFIQQQTPECEVIGACNLILKQNDILVACNTDHIGVTNSLMEANRSLNNLVCMLLGAGGAARAAAYAILVQGAKLLWVNRTTAHIPCSFNGSPVAPISLHNAPHHLPKCNIIVNTLPQSVPDTELFTFHPYQTVFDASYSTRPLERQAQHAGAKYIGGERWLLHQAIPSFTAMTGVEPKMSL
jgi:shikimate dehydrogenase